MFRVLGFLVLALSMAPSPARAGDLTLRDVIELHRSGLGEQLLIAVIEADGGPFQLGHADIMDLKGDGLSERVITALVRTGSRVDHPAQAPAVQVEQHVTTIVPGALVIGLPGHPESGVPDTRGRRGNRSHKVDVPPPATWVTRQDDGRNIAPATPSRVDAQDRHRVSSRPPAAWVTPNPIRTERGDRPGTNARATRPDPVTP